jgi:retron-type reverse transcriptase
VTYAGKEFHVATGPRGLPQGACTSPALSNFVARRLDSRLAGIAAKLGWNYSRYADDLTFSADGETTSRIGYLLARVRHIAQDEGFAVNEKKTRVLRQSDAQNVTGIIVNQRMGVPRDLVRRLRAILHRARTEGLAAQNRQNLPHFEMWLRGMIAYIHMVNPKQAAPLRVALEALVGRAGG